MGFLPCHFPAATLTFSIFICPKRDDNASFSFHVRWDTGSHGKGPGQRLVVDTAWDRALLLKDATQDHSSKYKQGSLDTEFHPESPVSGITRQGPLNRLRSTCSLLLARPSVCPQVPGQRWSQCPCPQGGPAYSERHRPRAPCWHPSPLCLSSQESPAISMWLQGAL